MEVGALNYTGMHAGYPLYFVSFVSMPATSNVRCCKRLCNPQGVVWEYNFHLWLGCRRGEHSKLSLETSFKESLISHD